MKILYLLLCLCSFSHTIAQIIPTQYLEIPVNPKEGSAYKIINLGENGLLTVLESQEYNKGKQLFLFTKYDTALRALWQAKPMIDNEHNLKMYYQEENFLYFLVEKKRTAYEVLEFDLHNGNYRSFKIEDIIPLEVKYFKVFNKIIFLAGEVEDRPAVMWFDYLHSKNPKVLPQINILKADVQQISYSKDKESISVLLQSSKAGKPSIYIQNYSLDGHLLNKIEIKAEKEYHLISFRNYSIDADKQLLIGTYGHKHSTLAQGFYVMHIENGEQKNIRFYDFSQFKNYFNYLSDKQQEKLFAKISEKQEKGKTKIHDFHILLSELIEQEDKLVLFAESYTTMTLQNSSYNAKNAGFNNILLPKQNLRFPIHLQDPNTQNNLVYHYKNAMLVALDKQGNIIWDNSYEYKDVEKLFLAPQTAFTVVDDSMSMVRIEKDVFQYKMLKNSEKNMEIQTSKTNTIFGEAKPTEDTEPEILAWHQQYFIAYGTERLKYFDKEKGATSREVFYISKFYCKKQATTEKTSK
jgi:hypothetical protein